MSNSGVNATPHVSSVHGVSQLTAARQDRSRRSSGRRAGHAPRRRQGQRDLVPLPRREALVQVHVVQPEPRQSRHTLAVEGLGLLRTFHSTAAIRPGEGWARCEGAAGGAQKAHTAVQGV